MVEQEASTAAKSNAESQVRVDTLFVVLAGITEPQFFKTRERLRISVVEGDELRATAGALVAAADSIAGSGNEAFLKIDYYNELYGAFGSAEYISSDSILLADGSILNDLWLNRELLSIAPTGAVEARLAVVFAQRNDAGGAVFVDNVSFRITSVPEPSSLAILLLIGCAAGFKRRRSDPCPEIA